MTDRFRQAADSENFPYGEDTTPFIMVKSGKVTWAARKTDKIAILKERGGKILAVWPGKWPSDVFEINDRSTVVAGYAGDLRQVVGLFIRLLWKADSGQAKDLARACSHVKAVGARATDAGAAPAALFNLVAERRDRETGGNQPLCCGPAR